MIRRLILNTGAAILMCLCVTPAGRAQISATAPASAAAPDAARLAKAKALFTVMHLDRTYAQVTAQLTASINASEEADEAQMLPTDTQTPPEKAEQAAFQARTMAVVMSQLSWQKLEPDLAALYANAYTAEQLDGLIAFYRSPLGQAVLDKTPELLRQSNIIAQQHIAVILPQLKKMIQDEAAKKQATRPADPSQFK